ncbi:hypothetical protein Daura_36595 [Dactylosporangium aurantiacum]|uniref:Uncharacterized protein n=1 Tax=Dactylosporangium aurantiacum TaxID=35754 RepID=A0A9Q9MJS0_9ACTN|nr:hypothetical protein [Dactylosporangium aurantiacum]MDG6108870.1 hypothetical protein [Dactylosporangium aurantiacum]UWZ52167.1 hypothetical protein Daura_36595 [Dactylosporangium aurantiacum]
MAVPVPVTLAAAALAASGAAALAGTPPDPGVAGTPGTSGVTAGAAPGGPPGASGGAAASPSMAPPSPGASPFASGAAWSAVNCAEVPLRVGGLVPTDAGGLLVPPGATTVTRCETPLAATRPGRPAPGTTTPPGTGTAAPPGTGAAVPRVLTTGVDRLTAVLNALPPVAADQACLPITWPVQLSLVFTYQGQPPVAVLVDPTCSALIAGDRARSSTTLNPLPVFDALYAAQPAPP